jgi:hypothetical protein
VWRILFQQDAGNATDHGGFNRERKGECSAGRRRPDGRDRR